MVKRRDIIEENEGFVSSSMHRPVAECKAFVIPECMSDEEDDEFYDGTTQASSIKVLKPGWRSQEVIIIITYIYIYMYKKKKKKKLYC